MAEHSADQESRVLAALDVDALVANTQRLVRVPGQNPPGEEEATAAELLAIANELNLNGERYDVAPDRPNVTLTLDGGPGPGLLLLGHTDVVAVGDGWTRGPFSGDLAQGRIHGRGATDMKGGLAACLHAMAAVRAAGVDLSGSVYLAALSDEEENGIGVRDWIERPHPDLLGCIVAEPTDLQTIVAARGACYLDVEVHGVAAHSGRPDDGRNAISGAAAIVAEIDRWHAEHALADVHPLVGPPTFNVGAVQGGTGPSIVPAHCRLRIDRRLLPDEDPEQVFTLVKARLDGLGLVDRGLTWSLTSPMNMPGFETPEDHELVQTIDRALGDVGGPGLPLAGWTAACDGGFVHRKWQVPVVVLGPGSVATQAHRADESVGVEEVITAARAYAVAILRLLARESTIIDNSRAAGGTMGLDQATVRTARTS